MIVIVVASRCSRAVVRTSLASSSSTSSRSIYSYLLYVYTYTIDIVYIQPYYSILLLSSTICTYICLYMLVSTASLQIARHLESRVYKISNNDMSTLSAVPHVTALSAISPVRNIT